MFFFLFLVITDTDKLKAKKLFDETPLVKLKGYKLIPKDSDKSNIMKILFPRKHLIEKLSSDANKGESTTDEQIISTIQNSDAKDLEKDFIQVDDILMVREPKDIILQSDNDLNVNDYVTTESVDSTNADVTEKPWDELTLAERLKIAAKRRMMKKMNKLELSLNRELFKREDVQSDKSKTVDEFIDKLEAITENVTDSTPEKRNEEKVVSETEAPKLSADDGEMISATLEIRKDEGAAVTESTTETTSELPTEGNFQEKRCFCFTSYLNDLFQVHWVQHKMCKLPPKASLKMSKTILQLKNKWRLIHRSKTS